MPRPTAAGPWWGPAHLPREAGSTGFRSALLDIVADSRSATLHFTAATMSCHGLAAARVRDATIWRNARVHASGRAPENASMRGRDPRRGAPSSDPIEDGNETS